MEFTNNPEGQNQDNSIIGSEEGITDDQTNTSETQADTLVSAEVSIPTAPIPLTHASNYSGDSKGIGPDNLPKSQVSVPSTSSVSKSNKSRRLISILPEDPEEKQKHII
jgi:hypothetical protein